MRARARSLKHRYDLLRERDPTQAAQTAADLRALARDETDPEVVALAAWTAGLAALQLDGEAARAIELLDDAVERYAELGQPAAAATIQVGRIHALALLGRYDDALDAAEHARAALAANGDLLALAKIEQNVGNILFRLQRYREAEAAYRRARDAYLALGDPQQLVQIDTCLAAALKWQHGFREATQLYEAALGLARQSSLDILEAEIACNLGCLELDQGRFDAALDHLEYSRRRFVELGLQPNATQVEHDLADAYLELNLAPEAVELAERVAAAYAARGLHAERARALVCRAQALLRLGDFHSAAEPLAEADAIFGHEGNAVGQSLVRLLDAERARATGDALEAAERARATFDTFEAAGDRGRLLLARWLHGDSLLAAGQLDAARVALERTLMQAHGLPQIVQRTHTSLGLLERAARHPGAARDHFTQAVQVAEDLRAPLPAEEFRTAFLADKLTPYVELTRLALDEGAVDEAFGHVEAARARALGDALGAGAARPAPRDAFEAALVQRLDQLREELSWYYSRTSEAVSPAEMQALYEALAQREATTLEIQRQLAQRGGASGAARADDLLPTLRQALGEHSAFVAYTSLDDELLAFVITTDSVRVVRNLASQRQVETVVGRLRLQMDTLRLGNTLTAPLLDQLTQRARAHLGTLHDSLVRPLLGLVGDRRLVVSPHRALHYVPFHALFDGQQHLVEQREVVLVPSARVLLHCLAQPPRPIESALLVAVADERTPRVRDEVQALGTLFLNSTTLLDDAATPAAVRTATGEVKRDVVHLACHGQFRPDNPSFSALRLAGGWLTVRDVCDLPLGGALVTLSACETGVSAVAPGDELVGLARGFFAAGARALVVSLWTVDDAATADLMASFYSLLSAGAAPAAALRSAQLQQLKQHPYPYYWSAFSVLGRW